MSDVVGTSVIVAGGSTPVPTLLIPPTPGGQEVLRVVNRDGTNSVFLGDQDVSSSGDHAGLEVKAGEVLAPFSLPSETAIYAFPAAGSPRVDVLRVVAD